MLSDTKAIHHKHRCSYSSGGKSLQVHRLEMCTGFAVELGVHVLARSSHSASTRTRRLPFLLHPLFGLRTERFFQQLTNNTYMHTHIRHIATVCTVARRDSSDCVHRVAADTYARMRLWHRRDTRKLTTTAAQVVETEALDGRQL